MINNTKTLHLIKNEVMVLMLISILALMPLHITYANLYTYTNSATDTSNSFRRSVLINKLNGNYRAQGELMLRVQLMKKGYLPSTIENKVAEYRSYYDEREFIVKNKSG